MKELDINTAKRGMRVVTGNECRLAEITPESEGYHGTIVEVTESIPEGPFKGQPGVLVYWDFLDTIVGYLPILTTRQTFNPQENLQWSNFR